MYFLNHIFIVRCSPSGVSGRQLHSWFHQSQQEVQVQKQPQTIRLPPCLTVGWCSFYQMLFSFHARCGQDAYLPESSTVVSSSLQRIVPKVFRDVPQQMWGLQFFRWCSTFYYDLLDEHCTLGWPTLFVDNGSDCCFVETQYLGNGFITLSRLTDFTHFDSQLFLNLFGSWHEVFLELFHFDRQVILKWIFNRTGGQQTLAF